MQCKKVVREYGLKAVNVIGLDMKDKGWCIKLEDGSGGELNAKYWKNIIK